jgi:hypothetical protein
MVRHSMTMAPMDEVMANLSENVAELDGSGVVDMFFTDYSAETITNCRKSGVVDRLIKEAESNRGFVRYDVPPLDPRSFPSFVVLYQSQCGDRRFGLANSGHLVRMTSYC